MNANTKQFLKWLVIGLIVLLTLLHQDFWFWDTYEPLIFGFIPIGLAYHAMISLLAGFFWFLAIKYCWPEGVDDVEEELTSEEGNSDQTSSDAH